MTNKNTCCVKCETKHWYIPEKRESSCLLGGACPCHKKNMPESWERDFESKFPAQDLYSCGDEELFDERNDGIIMFFRSLIAQERAKAVSEAQEEIQVLRIIIGQQACHNYDEARSRGEIKNIEV